VIRWRALASAFAILGSIACRERGSPLDEPSPPFALADSLRERGKHREALARYDALRDSFALAGDSANLWWAQLWWSDVYRRLGRNDSARAGLAQAMRLAGEDPSRVGWTRLLFSIVLEREGRLDSAFAEASAALQLARGARDLKLEAYAHDGLGTALSLRGRYREALAADSASLALRRTLGLRPSTIAQSLNEVGGGYRHLGRYTDAKRVYEEAFGIYQRLGDELGLAMISHNLSNIHTAVGEMDRAAELLNQSLRYSERLQHELGMSFNHNALASLYRRVGNRSAARRHAEEGLRITRSNGFKYGEILALTNLGRIELAEAGPGDAAVTLTAALSLADSAGFGRERVNIRAALVSAAIATRRLGEALQLARAARVIADSLGDPEAQYQALEAEGAALEAARRGAALDRYLQAIDLLESWRGRLAMGDLRMGVADPRLSVFEGAIRLLLSRDRPGEAFSVAERARARLLLELMADRDAQVSRSREQELRSQAREYYQARTQVKDPEIHARLDRQIAQLTAELASVEQDKPHPGPYQPAELQQSLLSNPQRALLGYFWGDSLVYGWSLTGDVVRGAALGRVDSLAHLVNFFRTTLEVPGPDSLWRSVARQAYQRFVKPLATGSAGQVLIIPDGPLAHIPFESVIPDSGRPWGATQQIVYGPSASVLSAGLTQTPRTRRWARAVLAVGNPTPRGRPVLTGNPARRPVSSPLPYAEREARDVANLFRAGGSDLLVGRSAAAARWLKLEPARYRYLHFAAHAEVSDRRPELTHLVLSDGPVDLSSIRNLQLSAELVTLSACETALGRRVRGEGIIGLPHAFLAAGARGVVVTLWRIGDQSASDFMREFYAELSAGQSPGEALRMVRSKWITSGGPSAHPARWAPFILVGGLTQ
jgi:CHAT domain-containing protein